MGFTKITSEDTANKGVVGLADTPNLSTQEMQAKFDELATDVIIPKFNELSTELDDKNIDERFDERVVSEDISNIRLNRDNQLETSKDGGETWETTASSGHIIENGAGTMYPSRARLQFSDNVIVMDDLVENKTFISIPAGEKGDKGESATIRVGNVEAGDSVKFENVGSDTDAIFDVTIPKGDKGDAATVRIGSVQTGDNPSVYNSGTTSNAIFNFVLPKGEKGDDGTSFQVLGLYATYADLIAAHPVGRRGEAYAVGDETFNEVYNWNTSTLQWDNLGALKGAKGDTGLAATVTVGTVTQGNTTSVENVGTSENAVFNFVLEKGEKGDTGNAATIAIGSVEAGDYPEVTNVGTDTNAVFDFKLQRGPQGPQGTPTTVNGKTAASIELDTRDLLMTGYVKEAEGDIATTDTLAVALSKLETRKSGGSIIKVTVDEELVGENITCANGEETYTKVATALTEFNVEGIGEWTITCGESEATVEISYFGIYETEIKARGAYNYQSWLDSASITKTFASLEEVLADEVTLRTLFTKHASVDYLVEWSENDQDTVDDILEHDLVAKWVNLRDYAFDTLYNGLHTKPIMVQSGKYGYGEWALINQVPKMTSATAPSGEVITNIATTSGFGVPYNCFDGDRSTQFFSPAGDRVGDCIGYKFTKPTRIDCIKTYSELGSGGLANQHFKIQAHNGTDWVDIKEYNIEQSTTAEVYTDTTVEYTQWRLYALEANYKGGSGTRMGFDEIQFLAWQPKGLVPIMTSNSAPYGECMNSSLNTGSSNFATFAPFEERITVFNDANYSRRWACKGDRHDAWLGYRFVNPTMVTRIGYRGWKDWDWTPHRLAIEYSYDGSAWTIATTWAEASSLAGNHELIEVPESVYAPFWRIRITDASSETGGRDANIQTLQFYGRQLKVSVPKMTSNTAPWGEVNTNAPISDTPLWKSFDGNTTTMGVIANEIGNYAEYDFGFEVCPKFIVAMSRHPDSFKVEGYNGSEWISLKDYTQDGSMNVDKTYYVPIENTDNVSISKIRVKQTTKTRASSSSTMWYILQFYGLDYSEHTERKWIYDHGVELEEISGNSLVKSSDSARSDATSSVNAIIRSKNAIDFTPYKLARLNLTTKGDSTGIHAENPSGTSLGYTMVLTNQPYNVYNSVENVNESARIRAEGGGVGNYIILREMWLE